MQAQQVPLGVGLGSGGLQSYTKPEGQLSQQGFGISQEPSSSLDRERVAREAKPPIEGEARQKAQLPTQHLISVVMLLPTTERQRIADALWRSLGAEEVAIGRDRAAVAETFRKLAEKWHAETAAMSSITNMAMHVAYQEIIGLGPDVVPILLRALEREPDHWFWALRAITRVDPVPDAARGRLAQMAEHWLNWGKEQGLL
jgi:hypothetical protein